MSLGHNELLCYWIYCIIYSLQQCPAVHVYLPLGSWQHLLHIEHIEFGSHLMRLFWWRDILANGWNTKAMWIYFLSLIAGLMQKICNSSAAAMWSHPFCIKPWVCGLIYEAGILNLNTRSLFSLWGSFLPKVNFGLQVLSLSAYVFVLVCFSMCVSPELVGTITHHPLKLGSPHLDHDYNYLFLLNLNWSLIKAPVYIFHAHNVSVIFGDNVQKHVLVDLISHDVIKYNCHHQILENWQTWIR